MSDKPTATEAPATKKVSDDDDDDPNRAGKSGWVLGGFFVVLLAMNATFFAVAFSNPPKMHPSYGAPANYQDGVKAPAAGETPAANPAAPSNEPDEPTRGSD